MRSCALGCPGGSFLDLVSPPPLRSTSFPLPTCCVLGWGGGSRLRNSTLLIGFVQEMGGGLFSDCFCLWGDRSLAGGGSVCKLILSLLWGGVVARPGTPLFSRVVVLFCWILLSSLGIWIQFAGADCHLLLASGYVSVGVYLQSQRDLSLKPKVHWTGSGSAALRLQRLAGVCLPRFLLVPGSGCSS